MSIDSQAERSKWAMLRVAVSDPPWNTGMAWVDAIDFFRPTDLDDEFKPRAESEGLARDEVLAVLDSGHEPAPGGRISLPGGMLSFRATQRGCDFFALLPDDASRLFPPLARRHALGCATHPDRSRGRAAAGH